MNNRELHPNPNTERGFKNEALKNLALELKSLGYKLYASYGSYETEKISYFFIEGPEGLAYVQSDYGHYKFSSVHKATNQGQGSGAAIGERGEIHTLDTLKQAFSTPYWFIRSYGHPYKYTDFNDYLKKGLGILKYYEL